jgi:hypothetical protein
MSDEEILRTMRVSESMARSLDLEIEVGSKLRVLRGTQVLYETSSVHGVHGFLVGWESAFASVAPPKERDTYCDSFQSGPSS